jgi:hypothetical protein
MKVLPQDQVSELSLSPTELRELLLLLRSINPIALLSKKDLAVLLRVNVWTIDRWRKLNPDFPKCFWLNANSSPRWRRVDIEQWLAARNRGGVAQPQKIVHGRRHRSGASDV